MTALDSPTFISALSSIPGPRAQDLVARDSQVYTPAAGRVYPFAIERGEGCYVWDVDGNRYLDMNAGIAVVAAGHAHPRMVQAIQEQAAKFIHMAGTDFYSEPMVKFGEKLTSLMPKSHEWMIFPTNSGTESVDAAIKLARYTTGRQGIIAFLSAFHGRTYGSLSLTASKATQRRGFFPLVPGTFHAFYANPYRTPFDVEPERVTEYCLNYIEKTMFNTIIPANEVAAIIVEPIQGEGGYIVPAPGFICGLRDICDRHGIKLIFDEVQSGVGRTGKMWAFEHECSAPSNGDGSCAACGRADQHVVPDIIASAKGLGGGVPIGAMIAKRDLMEMWEAGAHGNTYGGNALACAAAYEVLDLVENELTDNAARVGAYLMNGLLALKERYPAIGDVRGRGLMIGIDFVKDRVTKEPAKELANAMMEEAFKRGMLVLTCGASTVRLCPPLVLTEEQADEALLIFEATLQSLI